MSTHPVEHPRHLILDDNRNVVGWFCMECDARNEPGSAELLGVARALLEEHRRTDPHHEDMCALCRRASAVIAKANGAP